MENQLLTGEDVRFLAQQPDYEVNLMVGQMTTLMQNINDLQQDTDDKVAQLENQGWFKRLCNTVLGKNKATRQEIQKNNDKMVTYISQSVSQLYQMNLINEKMLCSLGNRMNEIYMQVAMNYQEQLSMKSQISELMAVQQQTLDNLGAFVSKLNEKIESVDNFHMLISEIQNGMYHDSSKLYNLCVIISQLDKRQMDDERKMNLLRDTMERAGVITDDEISVLQCLQDIVALPQEKIGLIYLELCSFRNSFPANLFADMIESYHFLSKMERMSKKKETIIQKLLDKYELESSAEFSLADVSDSFLENKLNSLVEVNTFQISMQSSNETEKNNQTSDVSETSSDKTEHSDSNTATDTTSACEVSYDNAPHTNDNGTAPNTLNEKSEPVAPATVVPPAITENEVASENTSDSLNDFSDVDRSEIEDVVNDLMEEINNFNFNSEYENENDELFEYDDSIECDPDDYNEEELESKTKAKAACKKALNSAIADVIEQYSTTKDELMDATETYYDPLKEHILEFITVSFFNLYRDLVDGFCTGVTKKYMLSRCEEFMNSNSADGYKNWENMIKSECNEQFYDNVKKLSYDTKLLDTKELFEQCDYEIEDDEDSYSFDISDACSEMETILIENIETMADELPDRIEEAYLSIKSVYANKLIEWINTL